MSEKGRMWAGLAIVAFLAIMIALVTCGPEQPPFGGEQAERICVWCRDESRYFFGADIRMYSDEMTTQKLHLDGGTGNVDSEGDGDFADDLIIGDDSTFGDQVTISGVTNVATDTEHIGLMTIDAAAITYESTGTVWTIGANEIWFVEALYCNITTNFDCTGNDCTLIIGDGNDTDGFLVLNDAEMQTDDAEFTGAPAGWKGLHTDSIGVYLSGLAPFVYDGTDTIDILIGGTSPAAGAGTCYVLYTRIQ